jgi:hypothetical protein
MANEKKVPFTSRLPKVLLKRLRITSARSEISIEEIAAEAIRRELDRRDQEVAR